jgi:RNA polymerase sigma factor (sigma-70 family)
VSDNRKRVRTRVEMNQSRMNDRDLESLMRAAQAGDGNGYIELLKAITPRVRQIVRNQRRFLRSEDVEDLVQDVLVSVHAVRRTYDPQRPFMPWLLAITRNRLADTARHYARHAAHEVQVDDFPVTFSEEGTNTEGEPYRDPQALRQAIRALPPGQREAIEMLKLNEMSLKEAAAVSGTSVAALKVSVHRAVTALRKALRKDRPSWRPTSSFSAWPMAPNLLLLSLLRGSEPRRGLRWRPRTLRSSYSRLRLDRISS